MDLKSNFGEELYMCQEFYWTAKHFVDDKPEETRYFESQSERDNYVAEHAGWKKRGKICAENLEKHLQQENAAVLFETEE